MRLLLNMINPATIAALVLILLVPLGIWWFVLRPLPPLDGVAYLPRLDGRIMVSFDAHAIPYIEASSDDDAYEAQGYISARDRMFQMDMERRAAAGQLAEIFGVDAQPGDGLMRTIGIEKIALTEYSYLRPGAKAALEAYARGVNAYLSQNHSSLSLEFTLLGYTPRPWRAEDSLAILKHYAYQIDESWRLDDLRQRVANTAGEARVAQLFKDDYFVFGTGSQEKAKSAQDKDKAPDSDSPDKASPPPVIQPKAPADSKLKASSDDCRQYEPLLAKLDVIASKAADSLPPSQPGIGSTAIAVGGSPARGLGALLACDKHSAFRQPCQWYCCSLKSPGLHIVGATIPGVPGIMQGRNENIAWGSAALHADVQDLFLERFNNQFDRSYKTPSGPKDAQLDTELIQVRFRGEVEHKVLSTKHGPVLIRSNDAAVALKWTGSDPTQPSMNALYDINHATGWTDFVRATTSLVDPPQLWVFADRRGSIGSIATGTVPVRAAGNQGTMLNMGYEGKGEWLGSVPQSKLPQAFFVGGEPVTTLGGAFIAAGQRPSSLKTVLPMADKTVMLGHQWDAPYRANRLLFSFTNQTLPPSLPFLNELQGDEFLELAPLVTKQLAQAAIDNQSVDKNGLHEIELLAKWDGEYRAHSPEPTICQAFLQTLMMRLLEPRLGRELSTEYLQRWALWPTFAAYYLQHKPKEWLPPDERTASNFLLTTLVAATKPLKISFESTAPDSWMWLTVHRITFTNQLAERLPLLAALFNIGPVGVGGGSDTLNANNVMPGLNNLWFPSNQGPSERLVLDMSDNDRIYESIAVGQSEHLWSNYRQDQLKSWLNVDPLPVAFSEAQLSRQVKHKLFIDSDTGR
jgi:penicillin amidase